MSDLLPLKECPPGLFWFNGTLGMKTEYSTESMSHPGYFQCDAYVVASGEYFWGGTPDPRERGNLMVKPIDDQDADSAITAWNQRHGRAALRAALEECIAAFDTLPDKRSQRAIEAARRALEES